MVPMGGSQIAPLTMAVALVLTVLTGADYLRRAQQLLRM
jgi:hypothetical protein